MSVLPGVTDNVPVTRAPAPAEEPPPPPAADTYAPITLNVDGTV